MSDRTKILEYWEWLISPLNLNLQECLGLRVITPIKRQCLITVVVSVCQLSFHGLMFDSLSFAGEV